MKTFVINLDRKTDRLEHTNLTLGFHGVQFERVSAIDYKDFVSLDDQGKEYVDQNKVEAGNLLNLIEKKYFCNSAQYHLMMLKSYDAENDLVNMSLSEVCVAQSHRKAWKLAQNYDYSLILEDDVTFSIKLPEILSNLENKDRGFDFDIFLLGWLYNNRYTQTEKTNFTINPCFREVERIYSTLFLQAYVITGSMAKRLAESTIIGPVDEYLSTLYPEINCYGIPISDQTEHYSVENQHSAENPNALLI
jgi:GR25 family glycosyltransferase involved in LPS biosynthesis